MLGINRSQLLQLLVGFAFILLLIFFFIFLGISAFTVGGGFSTVINTLIPVGAGGAYTKESGKDLKSSDLLKPEKIREMIQRALKITSSK